MQTQQIVGYIALYLCSVPFLAGIITGSFEYYTALLSPSPESINAFFQHQSRLNHYFMYLFPFKDWENYTRGASKIRGMIVRVFFSLFFGVAILFFLTRFIISSQSGDMLSLFLNLLGILIAFVCLAYGWGFGRKLSSDIIPDESARI